MVTLKSADILAGLDDEKSSPIEPEKIRRKRRQPKGNDTSRPVDNERGKPSPYLASLRERLRDKTQLNFGGVPRFVRQEFERLADQNQMGLREYFYHLLRQQGADIPPYEDMDGRKL
jgi:hypothetical protein